MGQSKSVLETIGSAVIILLLGVVYVVLLSAETVLNYGMKLLNRLRMSVVDSVRQLYTRGGDADKS